MGRGDITEVIRQHWDRRANTFDDDEPGHGLVGEDQRRAWLDLLARLVGSAPLRVLDVGCGTGFLAFRFAELGHAVTGVDLAPQMIAQARSKAEQVSGQRIEFRVASATDLDFPDATFDVVAARHVLWNLPDPERGLAEWLRVIRPGGRLALIEGKWADNEDFARSYAGPGSWLVARAMEAGTLLPSRLGSSYARRMLDRRYRRIEAQLPLSGGPAAERLVGLLDASGVRDVVVEPLMDSVLWGETPRFPRYLAAGTR